MSVRKDPFGTSPWPMVSGNAGNTGVASVVVRPGGKTLWSAPLAAEWGYRMVVGEDGGLFVASPGWLLALGSDGGFRWRRPRTGSGGFGTPMALASGSIVLTEDAGRNLLSLDQVTGEERWRLPDGSWSPAGPTATDECNIILRREPLIGTGAELCCLDPGGALRWSYRLSKGGGRALVMNDCIVVADGSYLTALDVQGNFLWLANRHGFVFGDGAKEVQRIVDNERFWTAPMRLDESRIIGGYTHFDGHEFLVLDPSRGTVMACEPTGRPFPSHGPIVVTPGPAQHFAGVSGNALRVFDVSGALLFERAAPWEILNIVSDPVGSLVVVEGVQADYWVKYKDAYNLHDACGLVGFDATGNQLFRWIAPGPMANAIAVGREGELYCISEGRLWAVG
jgi:outer membrane protein assembly factor BamB